MLDRGGSRAAATSKMKCFVIIVNGWMPLTIITKHFILDVAAALDPSLLETELLDFHLMTVAIMRKIFKKLKPTTINYRSYKHFSNESYRESLLHELSKEVFVNNDDSWQRFCDINVNIWNSHAPRNRKHAPGIQMPFIIKNLKSNDEKIKTAQKKEREKIKPYIKNKWTAPSPFWKNLKKNILQS